MIIIKTFLLASASRTHSLSNLRMVASKNFKLDRAYEESMLMGHQLHIVGCDEAGRGPLAGPVTAAAVYIRPGTHFENIMDSKAITSEDDREKAYDLITFHPDVIWSAVSLSNTVIDEMNILEASLKAMQVAVSEVVEKMLKVTNNEGIVALVDGNKIPKNMHPAISSTKAIVKGDSLCFSIAAASILAKVTRDRIMYDLHEAYPHYGFLKNKGYPTVEHRNALSTHGPSHVHRVSYKPVRDAMAKHDIDTLPAPFKSRKNSKAATSVSHQASDSIDAECTSAGNSRGRSCDIVLRSSRKRLLDDLEHEGEDTISMNYSKVNK